MAKAEMYNNQDTHKDCGDLGLYIHIPFCVHKCAYCDFFSGPASKELQHAYADALEKEIRTRAGEFGSDSVTTVYIGGGTPVVLEYADLLRILEAVHTSFNVSPNAEVTVEMNPGTVSREMAEAIRPYVNRISLGIQSFSDEELLRLGRIHTAAEAVEAVQILREAGYGNLSFDLMYGIPGQTLNSWNNSLAQAMSLHPKHISTYSLIIEEGTHYEKLYSAGRMQRRTGPGLGDFDDLNAPDLTKEERTGRADDERPGKENVSESWLLPSEEEEEEMTVLAERLLSKAGMYRYEISNFAYRGYESRHNIRYWRRSPYLGFGAGASSFIEYRNADLIPAESENPKEGAFTNEISNGAMGMESRREDFRDNGLSEKRGAEPMMLFTEENRWRNTRDLKYYLEHSGTPEFLVREREIIDQKAAMEEFMFLGLRMTEGVQDEVFFQSFGKSLKEVYGDIMERQIQQGFLRETAPGIYTFTGRGRAVSNRLLAEYLF